MDNVFLRDRIAAKIDDQVGKILHDLGNPEPPLNLAEVRELLQLDLHYYQSGDEGFLHELIHKARLGVRRVAANPMLIVQAIKAWDLKAMYLPDRKRILIDQSQPKAKWRWSEAHEIVHSVLDWHRTLMCMDSAQTLAPDCVYKMEAEANFGVGRLLFLQNRFTEEALSSTPDWALIKRLGRVYNNTLTSTLWRLVEALDVPAIGIVGFNPHFPPEDPPDGRYRYFIRSRPFLDRFSKFDPSSAVDIFESYCWRSNRGPLGCQVGIIEDDNGVEHDFQFESFSNTHEALTLATYVRKHAKMIAF